MHSGRESPGKGPWGIPVRDVAFLNFIKFADKPHKNMKEHYYSWRWWSYWIHTRRFIIHHRPIWLFSSIRYPSFDPAFDLPCLLFVHFSHEYSILSVFFLQCRLGKCSECMKFRIGIQLNWSIQLQGGVAIRTLQVHAKGSAHKALASHMSGGRCESFGLPKWGASDRCSRRTACLVVLCSQDAALPSSFEPNVNHQTS